MIKPSHNEVRTAFHTYEIDPSLANIPQLVWKIKMKTACDFIDKLGNGKKLLEVGLDYFESEDRFVEWLFNIPFFTGSKAPIDYLSDEKGAQIVIEMILRLEHGVL